MNKKQAFSLYQHSDSLINNSLYFQGGGWGRRSDLAIPVLYAPPDWRLIAILFGRSLIRKLDT